MKETGVGKSVFSIIKCNLHKREKNVLFLSLSLPDKQINGCSIDKQEDRGRRDVEVKPVELALTEEHMSCVTGMDQAEAIFFMFTVI